MITGVNLDIISHTPEKTIKTLIKTIEYSYVELL